MKKLELCKGMVIDGHAARTWRRLKGICGSLGSYDRS